jgi:hypothetical protein
VQISRDGEWFYGRVYNSRAMAEAEAAVLKAKYLRDGGDIVEKDGDRRRLPKNDELPASRCLMRHPQHHPLTVDRRHGEPDGFRDAQAGGVTRREHRPVLESCSMRKEPIKDPVHRS